MTQYKFKKSRIVDAMQCTDETIADALKFIGGGGRITWQVQVFTANDYPDTAQISDWIIKDTDGNCSVMSHKEFVEFYEEAQS